MSRQEVVFKKKARWELLTSAALIPVPVLVFITDGFVTKNMGPFGPFLYFAYLTHIKDLMVMFGVAVPDMIRACRVIKERQPTPTSPRLQDAVQPYNILTDVDVDEDHKFPDEPTLEIKYEITDVPKSKRTTVRYLVLNLSFTASILFFALVLPTMESPETLLEKLRIALIVLNHSLDTLIQGAKYVCNNIPLHTAGTKLNRFLKEYGLPFGVYASYAVFLYAFQALGGVDENGKSLYGAIDYEEDSQSAVIMSGALAVGIPVVNKVLTLCLEAIQFCLHSPAGSVRAVGKQFCSSIMSVGKNICTLFTRPCQTACARPATDLESPLAIVVPQR